MTQIPADDFSRLEGEARELWKNLRAKQAEKEPTLQAYHDRVRAISSLIDSGLRSTLENIGTISLDDLGDVRVLVGKSEIRYDPSMGVTIQLLNLQLGDRNYNPKSDSTPDIVPALLAEPDFVRFVKHHKVREVITPDGRGYDVQGTA